MLLLGRCVLLSALAWGQQHPPRSGPKARRSKGGRRGARRLEDTTVPTIFPTPVPTIFPTPVPTPEPTTATNVPTAAPTSVPTSPTAAPTKVPTTTPTARPTAAPSKFKPSSFPTTVPTKTPTSVPTSQPSPVPTPVPACCVEHQFTETGEVEGTTCYGGRSPWDAATMTDLCTAGYSEYGAAAPPFRDCRQEAIDSGNCGTGDGDTCAECGDHNIGRYWANVGYEACPDWVVDAINAEGASGGTCAAWTRDGMFVDNIACGETRYESTANAAHWLSGNDAPDHFYVITPAETAYYHFSTCGSDYDTYLYLYDVVDHEADTCLRSPAPHAGEVELIGEWDDPGEDICMSTGSREALEDVWTSQPLQAGATYVLQVTGYSDREDCDTDQERDAGAAGNYALAVDCSPHPPCQDLMCSGQRCICGRFGCDMDECCLEDDDGNNRGCCNPSFCDDGGADVRGQTIQCNDDHSGWTTCRVPQDSGEAFPEYFEDEDEDEDGTGCSHGWPAYPGDHPYDVFTDSGKCGRIQDWASWAHNEDVGTVADIAECWSRCQDLNWDSKTSFCASMHQTSMECSCQGADPHGDFDELECLEDVGEYTLAVHEGWRGSRCYGNDGRVCACDGGDYCLPSEDETGCEYAAGQPFVLVAETDGHEFSVGLNAADRHYHPDEGGNVHSNTLFMVQTTEGTKMLQVCSNPTCPDGSAATCCDVDGDCEDGDDDWCCGTDYYCSNDGAEYAAAMGGVLCCSLGYANGVITFPDMPPEWTTDATRPPHIDEDLLINVGLHVHCQDYAPGAFVKALGNVGSPGSWVVNEDGTISPHDGPHLILGWGDFTTASGSCGADNMNMDPQPNNLVLMDSAMALGCSATPGAICAPVFRARSADCDHAGHDDGSACDGIHLEAGVGEVCNWAHGETHGCPVVNTQLWDSELWSCDDLCGRAGGWCERAAYMSNNHCGSDVHEEYELSCDQGIRDIRTWGGEPSHTLCWCRVDGGSGDNCARHGLGPEYAGARPDGTPCDPGCECCRADGGCGECAGDHVCELYGDYGYCTSCEARFAGDDGLIEHCRNETGAGFDWDGTRYDNTCPVGHDDGSACDGIHLEAGVGEVCNWAHGETHGCPVVNTQLWDSELWSCDDLCGRAGGWCERAAYMSNNHCGSDVHEEYELSCDQGIRDIRTWGGEPSHTLCWCRADETDHWWHYYHEDDDDDGDGATELVMSGGLVAIGLTFTGISIAAIANAFQEQCALGPTIVYEAGTTHPYYISPNLCTIGTKTYASKKTVRDASPRKVCRKFCEAASAAGKLALKHVQGLTCYCKRR